MDAESRALEKTLAASAAEKNRLECEKLEEKQKMQRALKLPVTEPPPSAPSEETVSSELKDIEEK